MCDKDFIKDCLTQILGADTSDEILDYIVTIENEDDYNEFMENIVDRSNPDHMCAYDALKDNLLANPETSKNLQKQPENITDVENQSEHRESTHVSNSLNKISANSKNNKPAEKPETSKNLQKESRNIINVKNQSQRKESTPISTSLDKTPTGSKTNKPAEKNQKKQQQIKLDKNLPTQPHLPPATVTDVTEPEQKQTVKSGGKGKKLKFVNFYEKDHKPGLRKGRHPCNCEAMKHNLINNCIKCGRIVCEQEGSGPCFFCGNMVCTSEETELLAQNTKESDKFYNYLIERSKSKEWKKAIEARDRLLLNDSLRSATVTVYDDQSDYFKVNSSGEIINVEDENNDKLKMEFYSGGRLPKSELKVSLNLATRSVEVEEKNEIKNKDKLLRDIHHLLELSAKRCPQYFNTKDNIKQEAEELMEDFIQQQMEMAEEKKEQEKLQRQTQSKRNQIPSDIKVANEQLQEAIDTGQCLSLHQPYASLLVTGIKKHEGRTWRTDHRGRLWIAAASKKPTDDEILECEEMYRKYYGDPSLKFPRSYPVSCLLGCVHVEDCLPQKEYRELYPKGESDSPYVLICRNPVILPLFYPLSGQHKIFPLKKDLHRRARAALLSATWIE